MQSKVKLVLWMVVATFIIVLLSISIFINKMYCDNLLLIIPTTLNTSEISPYTLNKLNEESFLMTYETALAENLRVLNKNFDITLVKTNYANPFVMEKNLLAGSFFTEQDQKETKKLAILNKNAAYTIFGNINICGLSIRLGQEEYTITGIIDDKNKAERNIYIPAICSDTNPSALAVKLSDGLKEVHIKNKYISLGLDESQYYFINLENLVDLIYGIFFMGLKLVIISFFLFYFKKEYIKLRKSVDYIKSILKQFYIGELFRYYLKDILKMISYLIEITLLIVVLVNLILGSIEFFLIWHNTTWQVSFNDNSAFVQIYLEMKKLFFFSQFLVIGIFLSIILLLIGDCKDS